jgi:ABC-type uncharacterized transport system substrate-binding protein
VKYRGSCHCGNIAFEVEGLIDKAMACNCSICSRKGSLLWFVLMSYAPNFTDLWRRAADFVDKILKGTKPADLPVQQATKFEFLVNMNAAKQIGLTIPQKVLARADRVIQVK